MNPRRLYRCRDDRKIAGVAAGMAEYFDLDPTVVRVAWVLSVFLGGFTLLLYAILAFVMPIEPMTAPGLAAPAAPESEGSEAATEGGPASDAVGGAPAAAGAAVAPAAHLHRAKPGEPGRVGLVFGVLLIAFGAIALAGSIFPAWVTGIHLGPALILALGIALVVGAARGSATSR